MSSDRLDDKRLNNVLEFCRTCIRGDANVEVDPELPLGEGQTRNVEGRMVAFIGTKRRFGRRPWSKKEYLEFCITAGHELRHLEQRGLARFAEENCAMPVERDVCVSYWACAWNQCWYKLWNAKSALCEIDAEYCGLIYGGSMAATYCGITNTEKAVVAYCNRKVKFGMKAEMACEDVSKRPFVGYYWKEEDCEGKCLRSLEDVDIAFDKAEERVKANQPMYKAGYSRTDTYPFGDEFFDIMRRGRTLDDDCFDKFVKANRLFDVSGGCDLVDAMACLAVYLYPEDMETSPVDLSDLTAKSLFGSQFSETREEMIAYREYVYNHKIGIVNLGKPLDRYADGPVERGVDCDRPRRRFNGTERTCDDDLEPKAGEVLVDSFSSGTARSGSSDELHAGLEARDLEDDHKKAAEMEGLEYWGGDEIKAALAKPGLPDVSQQPPGADKDDRER